MKALKLVLWIAAVGCLAAVPFMVLPWSVFDKITLVFGIEPVPDNPLVMYILKVSCGVYGLIGVFFIILARNPLAYGAMLDLAAYGLTLFGLLSLIVGSSLEVPLRVFAGDSLSGLVLGIMIIVLSIKVKRSAVS
jgi:hypothetical protein